MRNLILLPQIRNFKIWIWRRWKIYESHTCKSMGKIEEIIHSIQQMATDASSGDKSDLWKPHDGSPGWQCHKSFSFVPETQTPVSIGKVLFASSQHLSSLPSPCIYKKNDFVNHPKFSTEPINSHYLRSSPTRLFPSPMFVFFIFIRVTSSIPCMHTAST